MQMRNQTKAVHIHTKERTKPSRMHQISNNKIKRIGRKDVIDFKQIVAYNNCADAGVEKK